MHATEVPEQGGLLLAKPRCAAILDPRYHQLVVFLAKHDRDGSAGFILNRPAPVAMGGLMGWGFARADVRRSVHAARVPTLPCKDCCARAVRYHLSTCFVTNLQTFSVPCAPPTSHILCVCSMKCTVA